MTHMYWQLPSICNLIVTVDENDLHTSSWRRFGGRSRPRLQVCEHATTVSTSRVRFRDCVLRRIASPLENKRKKCQFCLRYRSCYSNHVDAADAFRKIATSALFDRCNALLAPCERPPRLPNELFVLPLPDRCRSPEALR